MPRVLLLLVALLVLLGPPSPAAVAPDHAVATATDDCCPTTGATATDCCEFDLGGCCVGFGSALPVTAVTLEGARAAACTEIVVLPAQLLLPRASGPPPLPPPIA